MLCPLSSKLQHDLWMEWQIQQVLPKAHQSTALPATREGEKNLQLRVEINEDTMIDWTFMPLPFSYCIPAEELFQEPGIPAEGKGKKKKMSTASMTSRLIFRPVGKPQKPNAALFTNKYSGHVPCHKACRGDPSCRLLAWQIQSRWSSRSPARRSGDFPASDRGTRHSTSGDIQRPAELGRSRSGTELPWTRTQPRIRKRCRGMNFIFGEVKIFL